MRFNEFNKIVEDIKLPGKPQPGGASDGVVSHTPMKLGPIKYDLFDSPPPVVKQPTSPKVPVNYQIAPNMRPHAGPPKPGPDWTAKSALSKYQDPADISQQQQPAYQRAGKPDPYAADVSSKLDKLQAQQGKPKIDYKDYQAQLSKQKELQQQLKDPRPAVWKDPRTGEVSKSPPPMNVAPPARPAGTDPLDSARPGAPFKPNYSLANDPVGKANAGEPNMGTTPPAVQKNNKTPNAPASTSPISAPTAKPVTTTAPSQYQQAMNTVANIRKGFGKSNEYTNIYAPLGPTSFQNKQYIQDLEKEFRKTPNDPIIRAELDKMRGPGIVAAKGTGTAGGRTTDVNDPRLAADIRPGSDDIRGTGRGTGMANDPRLNTQNKSNQQPTTTAVKPPASTGTSAPAQSTSAYKGSAGAQAIQQANADKITDVNKIRDGDTIKVGGQDYTIKTGDTLDSIAKNQQSSTTAKPNTDAFPNTTNGVGSILNAPKSDPKDDADNQLTNVVPNDDMAEDAKSLNRIKSLAGLK